MQDRRTNWRRERFNRGEHHIFYLSNMIKARTLERVVHVARNDFLEEYTFFVLFISVFVDG